MPERRDRSARGRHSLSAAADEKSEGFHPRGGADETGIHSVRIADSTNLLYEQRLKVKHLVSVECFSA